MRSVAVRIFPAPAALTSVMAVPSPCPLRVAATLFMCHHFDGGGSLLLLLLLLHTYLLTPWCRVLLEKQAGLQLVKKFPAFHGTRKFITALTSVRHMSLSWASPIQSIYPHPTSSRSSLILSTHLRLGLPSGLLPSGLHTYLLHGAESFLTSQPVCS